MSAPPLHPTEPQRLAALRQLQILDTAPEERFDRYTRIARDVFDAPMAVICLVDAERQWFKSRLGVDATETPRSISFCGHAILQQVVFYIPDAMQDERFVDNPLVTGPMNIRFYAGAPLYSVSGQPLGTLCVLDSTSRTMTDKQLHTLSYLAQCVASEMNQARLAETVRELNEQRRYTENILQSVNEGIIAIDHKGIIRSFNQAAEYIFGYQARDVLGKNFAILTNPARAQVLQQSIRRYLDSGALIEGGINHELEGRRSDGTLFSVGLSIGKMEMDGKTMFNGVVRDISHRKKLERLKDGFITTVSHELRTPLTSIMGSLGLIKGGALGEIPDDANAMLEIAYSSSERLVRLVNSMLDLEKMSGGYLQLNKAPADLVQLARQAVEEIRGYMAQDFQLNIHISAPQHAVIVDADEDQLSRVITNLLSNAINHSPPGGTITVEVRQDNGLARLSVANQGAGIPAEYQPLIFERFTQASGNNERVQGGAGLGLSIAKGIVELHGGEIGFTTTANSGSTFFFELALSATSTRVGQTDTSAA